MIIRCFAALPVSADARGELERALAPFRERGLPLRWVRAEGVHITLKFFGEIVRDRLDAISEALTFAAEGIAAFGVTLSTLGVFPDPERARVLWLKEELQLDCMPCFERTCRFGHYRCLTSVTPDRVDQALIQAASASGATTSPAPPSRREGLGREQS